MRPLFYQLHPRLCSNACNHAQKALILLFPIIISRIHEAHVADFLFDFNAVTSKRLITHTGTIWNEKINNQHILGSGVLVVHFWFNVKKDLVIVGKGGNKNTTIIMDWIGVIESESEHYNELEHYYDKIDSKLIKYNLIEYIIIISSIQYSDNIDNMWYLGISFPWSNVEFMPYGWPYQSCRTVGQQSAGHTVRQMRPFGFIILWSVNSVCGTRGWFESRSGRMVAHTHRAAPANTIWPGVWWVYSHKGFNRVLRPKDTFRWSVR